MKIVGHRGARGLAPENTIAGLKKGLQHGVDMLEFDLRVTRDGVVILHHDPYLTDPDGERRDIANYDYAELKNHKKDLATFKQVLDTIGRKVPLYIEVKPDVPVEPIIKIIKNYMSNGWLADDFRLASFNQKTLLELQIALPDITKTVLEKWSGVRATRHARQLNTRHVIMNQRWLWWGFIRSISKSGYKLGAYTVNDPKKARRWEKHGLRLIVTDYPDRFEHSKNK